MMEWEVIEEPETAAGEIYDAFGDRYDFTGSEKEVLRLYLLFGFEDKEIAKIMQCSVRELEGRLRCLLGKTRTNSMRELQALFIRFVLQKLPANQSAEACGTKG